MKIDYRKAILTDAKQLSILYTQVYLHAYAIKGISDEFVNAVDDQFKIPQIEADILGDNCSVWMATCEDNPIGVLKIKFDEKCPCQSFNAPEIHKLYMLHHFYGTGVAQKLLSIGEEELRKMGESKVWLWVYEKNQRAIRFYENENYKPIGKADLQLSENSYPNIVMSKELRK